MKKLNEWLTRSQTIGSEEHRKRVLMAGYFILIYIGTGTFWLIVYLFDREGDHTGTLVGFAINLVCILLVRYGWFYVGTFTFLLRANAVTVYYAWTTPDLRSDLFFISAGLAAVAIFGFEKRIVGLTFSLLSLCLYVLVTTLTIVGPYNITHFYQQASFVMTYLSLMLLIMFFNFITNQYDRIIQEQNIALQESNATKDKFFSIIGHDLRGPINSLSSFSTLLIDHLDSLTKEEIKMLATDVNKSLKNLFALLENLLQWSRSQTGSIEFKPENFDLNALLEENKSLLKVQADTKQIRIELSNNGTLEVNAHIQSVNTVIRNLISNAIKFTPHGGNVTVASHQEENSCVVTVSDTGIGIPKSVVDTLFRIDARHTTLGTANEKGTGLGLILCKEFVEKNGGRIGVTSRQGSGSTFYFTLPLAQG